MVKKLQLSKKDAYLVALGIVISFMSQSFFDAVHNGLDFFNVSKAGIFLGSIISVVIFLILTFVFLEFIEDKK
jgi:uncharacterized membrane protein